MAVWLTLLRQSIRRVIRHPLYSIFAIFTLAIAMGGGVLVFSLYDAIALRPLHVDNPASLVSVRVLNVNADGESADFGRLSLKDFETLRGSAPPDVELAAWAPGEAILREGIRTERAEVQWVTARYFEVIGSHAARGRTFEESDDSRNGGAGPVVITDSAWTTWFDRDPDVSSKSIEVDGVKRPVIGVAPAGFRGFQIGADPALFALSTDAPTNWAFFRMLGRVKPGASLPTMESRLDSALKSIRAAEPGRKSFMIIDGKSSESTERIEIVDGRRGESEIRGGAMMPLALVGTLLALVLVVLGANLANLLAVRAISERGSAAIRLALGAPRRAVVGGWFVESLLLTLSGSIAGLVIVDQLGARLLQWTPLPRWANGIVPVVDVRTSALAVAVAIGVALLVGSLAAWEHRRVSPSVQLRESAATTTHSRTGARWRNVLVASQVALSVVLLVAMGLFVRSANALLRIDTGFPLDRVVTFRVDVPENIAEESTTRIQSLRTELARIPGVVDAGFSTNPILGGVRGYRMGAVEGYQPRDGEIMMINTMAVSPGFFGALEMPASDGRLPGEGEPQSVVINRQFADKYFADRQAVGRRMSFNMMRNWSIDQEGDLLVVAVVDDRMISDVRESPTPRAYALWNGGSSVTFYVSSTGAPMNLAPTIEKLVRGTIPEAAIGPVHTLADQRDRSIQRELTTRNLTLFFGVIAAVLAAFGLFAVISYSAGERRREFGLRQALGARPGNLLRNVIVDGLRPVLWGLIAGVVISAMLARFAESQLYGVEPSDPVSFAGAVALMASVAIVACLPAALRAARVDPARSLRLE